MGDPYVQGHRRMRPLLAAAKVFDIAINEAEVAIFEAGGSGFQIWCTPTDNPGGPWKKLADLKDAFQAGAFTKPCEFVAHVTWEWGEQGVLKGIALRTEADALVLYKLIDRDDVVNQPGDVTWARQRVEWLWQASTAAGPMPKIIIRER